MTVIVTGSGGPAGVAVIRALRAMGEVVVGADVDPFAVGSQLAHRSAVLPPGDDPQLVPALCELATRTDADVVCCTVTEEMAALNAALGELQAAGLTTWLPTTAALEQCTDKWEFARLLQAAGVLAPPTGLGSGHEIPGPWIVKPRFGRGSRDVYEVDDPDELPWVLARVTEPIVQSRIEGHEFTVDALVDPDGGLAASVPRWRLETKAGISTRGRTFCDGGIDRLVGEVLSAVGVTGPACVQGFVDASGEATVIEVNPRFSGGLPLSLAAGADLVGQFLNMARRQTIDRSRLRHRPDVLMLRHHDEVFLEADA